MNLSSVETLQLTAWGLGLLQFILALYILVLNVWHTANRHVSSLFLLFAINSFALGGLIDATDATQAAVPTYFLAGTTADVGPLLLLVAVVLLKPDWLRGRWRWVWRLVYVLAFLPTLLTLLDAGLGMRLWYTGLDAATYTGGYTEGVNYWDGSLALPIKVVNVYLMPIIALIPPLYVALRDKGVTLTARRLAWLLFVGQVSAIGLQFGLRNRLAGGMSTLILNTVFVLLYAFVTFQQMLSERVAQRGRLQPRVTALMLAVTVPLLVAVVLFVSVRAGAAIGQEAGERLGTTNRALAANVSLWLDFNVKALQQLVSLPEVVSMDPERQKQSLEAMAAAYPYMYLVSTTDLDGINVARNDDAASKDYSDRPWFLGAASGASLTFQTLVDRTSGELALVASMPIRDESRAVIGVGMFAGDLIDIAQEVEASTVGDTGFAYLVDAQNRVVAHPDPAFSSELRDLSAYPPILALRQGAVGSLTFVDEDGQRWLAYVGVLDNGWGVVVQQQEAEILAALGPLRQLSWVVIAAGSGVLLVLTWLTIRQVFRPIGALTDMATAIASGDYTLTVPIGSEDEVGLLARAFNSMTDQLRGLIIGLEQRVDERTAELAHRALQLQAAADVARVATSALNLEDLMEQAVSLIGDRFNLYHTSLFLLDETRRWMEYRKGTGEVGRLIQSQGLRLEAGGASMIGWCVAYAQPRVAQDVSQDALYHAYSLLPDTRSEAVLPLMARGRAIGALDVQSDMANAFSPEDVTVLQTVADQIAVAMDNVRLLTEAQESLDEAQAVHRRYLREAWAGFATAHASAGGYRYSAGEVELDPDAWLPAMTEAQQQNQAVVTSESGGETALSLPITLRGEIVGMLGLKKDDESEWTDDDIALAQAVADQVALSLENVRLFDEAQRRAQRETLVRELTDKMRRTNEVDAILETAVQELGKALGSARAFVRLGVPPAEHLAQDDGAGE